MRRIINERNRLFQFNLLSRPLHSSVWDLPRKMGRVIKLGPDKKDHETQQEYQIRSLREVKLIKELGDKNNEVTLIIRGTVISAEPAIQREIVELFTQKEPLKTIPQRIAKELIPGHISLYYNATFISHLNSKFKDRDAALLTDVKKGITDGHNTSFYAVQLNTQMIKNFEINVMESDIMPYNLKPSNITDNCSSAIAKKITPASPLEVMNINPIAAMRQMLVVLAEENGFHSDDSYARIVTVLRASGLTRNLGDTARDEHDYKTTKKSVVHGEDSLDKPAEREAHNEDSGHGIDTPRPKN